MYCPNCGVKLKDSANFCESCGHKLKVPKADNSDNSSEKNNEKDDPKLEKANMLWAKFLEIIRAEGADAEKYNELLSEAAWDMIGRFSTNAHNSLLESFKLDLDKQPYKAIEAIKTYSISFVSNGYRVFIAERLLEKKKVSRLDLENHEDLAEEWQRVYRNYANKIVAIPESPLTVLAHVHEQIGSTLLFENNPTLKELPNAVVEEIKEMLVKLLINGYLLGFAEENLRAQKENI